MTAPAAWGGTLSSLRKNRKKIYKKGLILSQESAIMHICMKTF
jgi:hypothetical protein